MHGINLGKMSSEGSPGAHLNPSDRLHGGGHRGGQRGIACLATLFLKMLQNKNQLMFKKGSKSKKNEER